MTNETFLSLLDYAYFKDAVVAADVPADYVDDTGFDYTRLVPDDRVADDFCECLYRHIESGGDGWDAWVAEVCDDCGSVQYWPSYG